MENPCERPLTLYLHLHPSLFSSLTLSPVFRWRFLPMLVMQKPNRTNKTSKHNSKNKKPHKTNKQKTPQQTLNVNRRFTQECNQERCCKSRPRIRPSKIQKLSAICNYGGNCYFKMFSFFQRNSMLLAEILGILNHSKSLCSWWGLNIIGNQNNTLSTCFSWLKKK